MFPLLFPGTAGTVLYWVLTIGAVAGLFTTWNGFFTASANLLMAMARGRLIPKLFAKQNANGVAVNGQIVCLVLSLAGPFVGANMIDPLTTFSAAAFMLSWTLTAWSLVLLRKNHPEMERPYVDAVSIPVIAAGGIADGRGFAAAFMLGAEAVQLGTRFVAAKESIVHENYKAMLIKAKDIDSAVTGMSTGHPVRSIRNKMTKEYLKMEKEGADFMELEKLTLGSLRKAVTEGDVVNGTVMAGQIAGLVKKEQPCKEIISEIMEEGLALMRKF